MEQLLPDRLQEIWAKVESRHIAADAAQAQQDRLLNDARSIWAEALILDGHGLLHESLLRELGAYLGVPDLAALAARCREATTALADDWRRLIDPRDSRSVQRFYDENVGHIFDLMWWHTLGEDDTPLAYVVALDFAKRQPGRRYLDFGSGVGSGAIIFGRHGFDVALADISSTLLRFCRWRLARRSLSGQIIDLKDARLAPQAWDIITAMDVFEHLTDPIGAVDYLAEALTPGGYLFGRFAAEADQERPQHIVLDFAPVLDRLRARGFTQVWRDGWLWGHQIFQKRC